MLRKDQEICLALVLYICGPALSSRSDSVRHVCDLYFLERNRAEKSEVNKLKILACYRQPMPGVKKSDGVKVRRSRPDG